MRNQFALLADGAGDGTEGGGGGAPAGGSPNGGQDGSQDDGETISKTQFIAALNSAERKREAEVAALRAEMEGLKAQVKAKPADAPKRYSRADLNAAVEAGQITQAQADAQWEAQVHEDAETRAERVALAVVSGNDRKKLVDSELARYTAVAPEILDDSHDARKDIKAAFKSLVELGDDPKDVATQLKAVRSVMGPIDRLERSRGGRSQHEHHRETGGGSGGSGSGQRKTGKLVDQLTQEAREHYENQIKRGHVKDWAAVEDELKYASPGVKRRLGIAA